MNDLNEIKKMAKDLIKVHCPEYKFKFIRAVKILGRTDFVNQEIHMSRPHAKIQDIEILRNNVLHEIAHVLSYPFDEGHGKLWKEKCLEIGAIPQRKCVTLKAPKGKYKLICPNCGEVYYRYKKSKYNFKGYYCSKCNKNNELKLV